MAKMYDGAPNHISLPYLHNTTTLVPNSPHKDEIEIRKPALKTQKRQTRTKLNKNSYPNPQTPHLTPLKTKLHTLHSTPHKTTKRFKAQNLKYFSLRPYKNNSLNIKHFPTQNLQRTTPKYQAFPYTNPTKQLQNVKHFPTQTLQKQLQKRKFSLHTL